MSLSEEEEDDEYVVDVMRAMFDFTGKAEANQISFMKNDVLQVLPRGATCRSALTHSCAAASAALQIIDKIDGGWWWGATMAQVKVPLCTLFTAEHCRRRPSTRLTF